MYLFNQHSMLAFFSFFVHRISQSVLIYFSLFYGSGCGTVGRAVASYTGDPRLDSSRQQFLYKYSIIRMAPVISSIFTIFSLSLSIDSFLCMLPLSSFLNHCFFTASVSLFLSFQPLAVHKCSIKTLPMTEFKVLKSGVRSDCSSNWATTTPRLTDTTHLSIFPLSDIVP